MCSVPFNGSLAGAIEIDPFDSYVRAYIRRADAVEATRMRRHGELRMRAHSMASALREMYGDRVRVFLFGSLLDPDRFVLASDIDLAVLGLSPSEYWEAWRSIESFAAGAQLDFVRLESASQALRKRIRGEGEELP